MDPDSCRQVSLLAVQIFGNTDILFIAKIALFLIFCVLTYDGAYYSCIGSVTRQRAESLDISDEQRERIVKRYKGVGKSTFTALNILSCTMQTVIAYDIYGNFTWGLLHPVLSVLTVIAVQMVLRALPIRFYDDSKEDDIIIKNSIGAAALKVAVFPLAVLIRTVSGDNEKDPVTEEEIMQMVDAGNESGGIEESEREMINNVFEFHDTPVSNVMTHRTDVVAVSMDEDISKIAYTAINSGFSRIPVYNETIDDIAGIIYVKDLLILVGMEDMSAVSPRSFIREAQFVPETVMCDELFKVFTARRIQFAVVVDEYGGTSGIVTMEDIVESIFGNIRDEYDDEDEDITAVSDNVFTINGNADAKDVLEYLGAKIPDDFDYDTISAFVTKLIGHLPEDGETPEVRYDNIRFTVLVAEDMRIEKIKAEILKT
ncbi:MAG: HlyC/CorC family transporter [Oscillospiraceae bacterium]|nr:HlyC/CorC family transporter [Oscillospiraceae bacterium]